MEIRRCETCMYARRPTGRLLRLALHDFPGLLICFRCAESDGEMNGVSPGGTVPELSTQTQAACNGRETPKTSETRRHRQEEEKGMADPPIAEPVRSGRPQGPQTIEQVQMDRESGKSRTSMPCDGRMGEPSTCTVDHERAPGPHRGSYNCNSLDNRRENLRICTWRQNQANRCSRRGCVEICRRVASGRQMGRRDSMPEEDVQSGRSSTTRSRQPRFATARPGSCTANSPISTSPRTSASDGTAGARHSLFPQKGPAKRLQPRRYST